MYKTYMKETVTLMNDIKEEINGDIQHIHGHGTLFKIISL